MTSDAEKCLKFLDEAEHAAGRSGEVVLECDSPELETIRRALSVLAHLEAKRGEIEGLVEAGSKEMIAAYRKYKERPHEKTIQDSFYAGWLSAPRGESNLDIGLRNEGDYQIIVSVNGEDIIKEIFENGESQIYHFYNYRIKTDPRPTLSELLKKMEKS